MNKQPFYHTAVILITATREIGRDEFSGMLSEAFKQDVAIVSIECEGIDAEPGDPSDLM